MIRQLSILSILGALAACSSSTTSPQPVQANVESTAQFDASAGQLPEGLAVSGDIAYVGFAPTGEVARVDLTSGSTKAFGQLPAPVPNQGFMTGLALGDGVLYAALVSFNPEVQAGIYELPAAGGDATLLASHEGMSFPNSIVPDGKALFVTDSGSGTIFRIEDGQATPWVQDQKLVGEQSACEGGAGFDIGANGLVVEADALYTVNTDKATLIRIPRAADGSPGQPEVLAGPDCAVLAGADGLVRDGDGFLVAVNRQNAIARVSADGHAQSLVTGKPLDFPATLVPDQGGWLGTNFAFASATAGTDPQPGLFRLKLAH